MSLHLFKMNFELVSIGGKKKKMPATRPPLFCNKQTNNDLVDSTHPPSPPLKTLPMAVEDRARRDNHHRILAERCRVLENSQAELRRQVDELLLPEKESDDNCSSINIPGFFYDCNPYRRVLELIGHAVHVCSASTGGIIYWNQSAENLYGWEAYDVMGQRMEQFLAAEEYVKPLQNIMEKLIKVGQPWSGQFPFKKSSGEVVVAITTMDVLYEDGQILGFVVVSSDAAFINNNNNGINLENPRSDERKRLKWPPPFPQIGPVPQIASSASNLASKVLFRRSLDDDQHNGSVVVANDEPEIIDAVLEKPAKLVEKLLEKLQFTRNNVQESNGASEVVTPELNNPEIMKTSTSSSVNANDEERDGYAYAKEEPLSGNGDAKECSDKEASLSEGSEGSQGSGSRTKCNIVLSSMVDCEIQWEELQIKEAIGQGSYGVVHRGSWKGSDVAIKIYLAYDYDESNLHDFKKEIDIMKKLRHPNVLLFMGAVYSLERLAIITEFLPRGSLFMALHKSKQEIDIRRRMRMAIDVVRGMNYLHHRNPPIIHRDLKSSNLLVDRNWNVKVGDFGLSRLKDSTLIATKSGRGTPQWMAPEVLRNEPSNEKSDVFSFGVILWELMTRSIPWDNLNSIQVIGVVGFTDRRLDVPEDIDPEMSSIINDCWQSDLNQRPSFEDILKRMTTALVRTAKPSAEFFENEG